MKNTKKTFWNFLDHLGGDKVVWIIVTMLILTSLVCIFSSTSRLLRTGETRVDIIKSQFTIVFAGLVAIILCCSIKKIEIYRKLSISGFIVSALLLVFLDAGISIGPLKAADINTARRVIKFGGIQIHVFEIVKVAMVLYLAWAMDALKKGRIKFIKSRIWQKILLLYVPFLTTFALILPGSNSSAIFIGGLMLTMLLLGEGNLKDLLLLGCLGVTFLGISFGVYEISDGKYMKRIGTLKSRLSKATDWEQVFLDSKPGTKNYYTALDKIRQPYSAKIAVHEGGLIGKGAGQSTQRYVVPDISEDFMFSFIIEEYGLLGGIIVIILYVSLLARGSLIAKKCSDEDYFAKLAVAGLCLLITGQAFLHMFVNADLGLNTGQTLPLISHGNSAFLCFCIAFGIILSISRITAKAVEKETMAAAPLMETSGNVKASLEELDDFESGKSQMYDEDEDYDL